MLMRSMHDVLDETEAALLEGCVKESDREALLRDIYMPKNLHPRPVRRRTAAAGPITKVEGPVVREAPPGWEDSDSDGSWGAFQSKAR